MDTFSFAASCINRLFNRYLSSTPVRTRRTSATGTSRNNGFLIQHESTGNRHLNIGPSLYRILRQASKQKEPLEIQVLSGDVMKENMGVTHTIRYERKDKPRSLIFRMRYDLSRNQFHIVGFSGSLSD